MNLLHCIKECYGRKLKMDDLDSHNPFRDVKVLVTESEGNVHISIVLDSAEKLDLAAVKKVIAEMLTTVLIEEHLVEFTETESTENSDILYTGTASIEGHKNITNSN